jgi:hypothetical protein
MFETWKALTDPAHIPVTVGVIAFTGVLLSALVSAIVARRGSYITAVTAERSKWIDRLRTNIAELLGALGHVHTKLSVDGAYRKEKEYFEDLKTIDTLIATITLQLNPRGSVDTNIIKLLERMPGEVDSSEATRYRDVERALVLHSQRLLKEEWEKVKYEARLAITRPLAWPGRWRRAWHYTRFCKTKDSFVSELTASNVTPAGPLASSPP